MNIAIFTSDDDGPLTKAGGVAELSRALAGLGHDVTICHRESRRTRASGPDAGFRLAAYRDEATLHSAIESCAGCDTVLEMVGHDDLDRYAEESIISRFDGEKHLVLVDTESWASLDAMGADPSHFRRRTVGRFDQVLVCTGGPKACAVYERLGAKRTLPVRWTACSSDAIAEGPVSAKSYDMALLADMRPGIWERATEMLFDTAEAHPSMRFLLAGSGWEQDELPANVRYQPDQARCPLRSARFALVLTPNPVRKYGFCPSTALFQAAASGTCVVTDPWQGLKDFYEIGSEVLVANSGRDLSIYLNTLDDREAAKIGRAARERTLNHHTYRHRALELIEALGSGISHTAYLDLPHAA